MVGFGYDIHRLAPGGPLVLGGITIPFDKGSVAHSDGDAALHAVCDALLGAAALGDIGKHFPDSSAEFKGISSLELLRRVAQLLRSNNYTIINIDVTIVLEQPKLAPHIPHMCDAVRSVLDSHDIGVSIKATTNEKLGNIGSGDAVAAFAVTQIERVT